MHLFVLLMAWLDHGDDDGYTTLFHEANPPVWMADNLCSKGLITITVTGSDYRSIYLSIYLSSVSCVCVSRPS